jgi:ComF family protein
LTFDRALAIGNYSGLLRELVVRMKNQHDEVLAIQFGIRLGYELLGQGWTDYDFLVPVPLHWSRRLKRGFQATDLLSEQIARVTGIRKCEKILKAVRATQKQGMLSFPARIANVRNAYAVQTQSAVKRRRVLLIDDVLTTGATTSELARILKANGAAEVNVAVVARGGLK